ncbi:MAG: hypothetical protein AB7E76_09955 [Deferribacterales bacterium]
MKKLEDKEIIISTIEFNQSINKTKWYRIDYKTLADYTGLSDGTDLIIDEYPLLFQPSLAVKYGLNEAIFLQQLHYWLSYSSKERGGCLWVVNKYKTWLDQFSFWSVDTLKRTIKSLTEKEAIINTDEYNDSVISNLRWLTINYDKFNKPSVQNDQSSVQSDLSRVQIDQTLVQSDQSQAKNIASVQNDRTCVQSDQTSVQNDHIASADWPDGQCKMTSSHIYTETNTETTETIADEVRHEETASLQKKINFDTETVNAAFDKAVGYYLSLIDPEKTIRRNDSRLDHIQNLMAEYGAEAVELIFDGVKKSDFLLGHSGKFKPSFSFILNNAGKVISGQYESETESVYEKAQRCCSSNTDCSVIMDNFPARPHCRYCDQFINKDLRPKKTPEEVENEMFEECKARSYCVVKKLRMSTPFPYCGKCTKNDFALKEKGEAELRDKAAKCYESCSGCCFVRVMETEPLDYCIYCPGHNNDPDDPDKTIKADPADSEAVWSAAFKWADKSYKKIKGFIRDFEVFSTYSTNDYRQEVLIVVYEVLQEMLAEFDGCVPVSKFEERIWNNFRSRFTKGMQTVPAMRDVFKDGNKSACVFEEFTDNELSVKDDEPENGRLNEEIIKTLLGILTVREEEVLDYVLGFTDRGKLSQSEAAVLMGTTRDNVAVIQKKAVEKITSFCKEQGIDDSCSIETIKFKIRTYQKQKFKDPAKYNVFEIGSLINQIAG